MSNNLPEQEVAEVFNSAIVQNQSFLTSIVNNLHEENNYHTAYIQCLKQNPLDKLYSEINRSCMSKTTEDSIDVFVMSYDQGIEKNSPGINKVTIFCPEKLYESKCSYIFDNALTSVKQMLNDPIYKQQVDDYISLENEKNNSFDLDFLASGLADDLVSEPNYHNIDYNMTCDEESHSCTGNFSFIADIH